MSAVPLAVAVFFAAYDMELWLSAFSLALLAVVALQPGFRRLDSALQTSLSRRRAERASLPGYIEGLLESNEAMLLSGSELRAARVDLKMLSKSQVVLGLDWASESLRLELPGSALQGLAAGWSRDWPPLQLGPA